MKRSCIFRLALLGFASVFIQSVSAASAVAWDRHGHMGTAVRPSLSEAKQRALDLCRRTGGLDPTILAASDVVGYGAIAIARLRTGSVIGVSIGRPSPADAENRAIAKCLRAGGTNPKIRCGWQG
jgi:hypothetical protein